MFHKHSMVFDKHLVYGQCVLWGGGAVLAHRDMLISLICKIHARFDLEICPGKGLFQGDVDC